MRRSGGETEGHSPLKAGRPRGVRVRLPPRSRWRRLTVGPPPCKRHCAGSNPVASSIRIPMRRIILRTLLVSTIVAWFAMEHVKWRKAKVAREEEGRREAQRTVADDRRGLKKAKAAKYSVN